MSPRALRAPLSTPLLPRGHAHSQPMRTTPKALSLGGMTQAAKDRKGVLILGAARGDFSKGRKESTRTGMYWVRPDGFLARMVSSSPSARLQLTIQL